MCYICLFRTKTWWDANLGAPCISLETKQIVVIWSNFRLNNNWASGTVLRPFLQPESPLSSQELGLKLQVQASGFKLTTPILEAAHSDH